jgi:hypothetical protein
LIYVSWIREYCLNFVKIANAALVSHTGLYNFVPKWMKKKLFFFTKNLKPSIVLKYFIVEVHIKSYRKICKCKIRKSDGDISTSWISDFSFMNSRFQLLEFSISTSRIQDLYFTAPLKCNLLSSIQMNAFKNHVISKV